MERKFLGVFLLVIGGFFLGFFSAQQVDLKPQLPDLDQLLEKDLTRRANRTDTGGSSDAMNEPSAATRNVTDVEERPTSGPEVAAQGEDESNVTVTTTVPNYPPSVAAYRHATSACRNPEKIKNVTIEDSVIVNETRTWPTLSSEERLEGPSEHERCHRVMRRQLVILKAVMDYLNLTTHWFISHGSLLGAVRHGGMIPWDVDVDVVMPRSYITKLRQEWRNLFPRDMFLQTEKTESTFHMWVGKERGVRIKDRYSTFHGMKYTFWSKGKKYKQKKWHLGAHIDIIPLQRLGRGRFKLLHHYFNYSDLFPTAPVCFEDVVVPAPGNISAVLDQFYGDGYMSIPNTTFGGPTVLPCKATYPSAGSAWSLSWDVDYVNKTLKASPRGDPHGNSYDDRRRPYG